MVWSYLYALQRDGLHYLLTVWSVLDGKGKLLQTPSCDKLLMRQMLLQGLVD